MIDVLAAERAELVNRGPRFRVVCRSGCPQQPLAVFLLHRGEMFNLALSPALLMLFVHLATCRLAQSSAQIAEAISRDGLARRKPSRSSVKVWIDRLRRRIAEKMELAGMAVGGVVVSVCTESNAVLYRIEAAVELSHEPTSAHAPLPTAGIVA